MIKQNETKIWLAIILIVGIISFSLAKCKPTKTIKVDVSKYEQNEKALKDSIKILSKQIKIKEVLKEKIVTEYKVKVKTITEYKEKLVYSGDTATLITIYDSTLYLCDSLNLANNDIIFTQNQKINALDSIYSNEARKSKFYAENIKELNKTLKRQHRQSNGKIIGFSSLSFLGGIGTGFLIKTFTK